MCHDNTDKRKDTPWSQVMGRGGMSVVSGPYGGLLSVLRKMPEYFFFLVFQVRIPWQHKA